MDIIASRQEFGWCAWLADLKLSLPASWQASPIGIGLYNINLIKIILQMKLIIENSGPASRP
jgi:hypothetical protein